jgi:hypothetical protein
MSSPSWRSCTTTRRSPTTSTRRPRQRSSARAYSNEWLAAVLNNDIVIVGGHGAIIADITTWGWVHLILGSIMALTGLGLFAGSSGARWAAIFFVMVNAIAQIAWFPTAPLWSFLMILLDVTIIYQLTARWDA